MLALVSLVAFGLVERRVAEPILPLGLFANRNFALISMIGFLLGFAMFGAMNFLPLYQQTVQGASATNSGLLLLPLMFGMLVVSLVVGRTITKTGRYRMFPIVGGVVMAVGMALLSRLDVDTGKLASSLYMVVLGAGMGFLMQTSMLIAQNSVEQKDLGAASGAATFFRSIGGSFGISLFGAIFANRLAGSPAGSAFEGGTGEGRGMDLTKLKELPTQAREVVLGGLSDAISHVFFWAMIITIAVPVLAWFIREIPLRTANDVPPPDATPEEQAEVALGKAPIS